MKVILMGHRRGISRALEKLKIPFIIWSHKEIINKTSADKVITAPYPKSKEELYSHVLKSEKITHVIAGVEDAVVTASHVRTWLKSRRNPHSVIIKCTDKLKMKEYLKPFGIPMTDFVSGAQAIIPEKLIERLGTPVIVKPRHSSGGRGIELISQTEQLKTKLNRDILVEKVISGTEGSVESFLSDGEICFTNITEYRKLGHCNIVPCHYDQLLQNRILELNQKVLSALNIQWGMTHLEFYITPDKILFGEIALRPPGGYIMEALELSYGMNFWDLFTCIELGLDFQCPKEIKNYSAALVFHPSEGRVESIEGLEKIKTQIEFEIFKLKIKEGDLIDRRLGVGQDVGHALLKVQSPKELIQKIDFIDQNFKIKIKN